MEAQRKAKDAQAAAGKSNGMSGRDLVRNTPSDFAVLHTDFLLQFTYNPEWFADEEEESEEEWDLEKYRQEQQAENDAAEAARIAALNLEDGYREPDVEVDGGNQG